MSNIITPAVARESAQKGLPAARKLALRYISLGGAPLALYFLVLALFPGLSLRLFYDSDKYVPYALLLQLFVASYISNYLATTVGAWLQGLGHSRWNFYVQIITVIVTLLIGLPSTWLWGTTGLVVGGFFSTCATTLASFYYIRLAQKHPEIPPDPVKA